MSFGIRFVCAFALAGVAASPCAAQSTQPPAGGNPFAGLFKGTPQSQPHRLDANGSTFVAWDDNVLAHAPGGPTDGIGFDPRGVRRGIANGFQTSLAYAYSTGGTRSQFSADANGALQSFNSTAGQSMLFESYNAGAGLRTNLSAKTSLSFGGRSTYAPYYQYAPFLQGTMNPDSPVGTDIGYAVASQWVRSDSASANLENRFSKRSRVYAGAGWEQRRIPDDPRQDIETRSINAGYGHNLTKKLAFHVGYTIQESMYASQADGEPLLYHSMDVGLGYGDGFTMTFGRHYRLSMNVGASIAKNGDPRSVATTGKSTQFLVTGGATLSRSIGRTWGTSIGYLRSTSYVIGFNEPLLMDSANAGIGGPIKDRLHFSAGVGAARGQQVFQTTSNPLTTYTASTKLTFALFKNLGVYTQASYYRYGIPDDFRTTYGFTPDIDRRSVSAGLSAWLPLIKPPRTRRGDPAPDNSSQQSDRDTR